MKNNLSLRMINLFRFKSCPILIAALLSVAICCSVSAMAASDIDDFSINFENRSAEQIQKLVTYPGARPISPDSASQPLKLANNVDEDDGDSVQAILYKFPEKLTENSPFEAEFNLSGLTKLDIVSNTVASFVLLREEIKEKSNAAEIIEASNSVLTVTLGLEETYGDVPGAPSLLLQFNVTVSDKTVGISHYGYPDPCFPIMCFDSNLTIKVKNDGSSLSVTWAFVDDVRHVGDRGGPPLSFNGSCRYDGVVNVDDGVAYAGLVAGEAPVNVSVWSFRNGNASDPTSAPSAPSGPATSDSGLTRRQYAAIFGGVAAGAVLGALALFFVCCCCGKKTRGTGGGNVANAGRSQPPKPTDVERGTAPLNYPSPFEVSGTASWIKPIQAR